MHDDLDAGGGMCAGEHVAAVGDLGTSFRTSQVPTTLFTKL